MQVLSEDYWEGYYATTDGNIIKCSDTGDGVVSYTGFNTKNGSRLFEGEFAFTESAMFQQLADKVSAEHGVQIFLRISNESENPDRHGEIDDIISSADRFQLFRVQNLIKHLKNGSISILGGKIGGQEFYDGDYGGFYMMEDGTILLCYDLPDWGDDCVDQIVDGVAGYRILDPSKFAEDCSMEEYFGYLQGERFSELAQLLSRTHGRIVSEPAKEGSELYDILKGALAGDAGSAAIASHRLRINLCIRAKGNE